MRVTTVLALGAGAALLAFVGRHPPQPAAATATAMASIRRRSRRLRGRPRLYRYDRRSWYYREPRYYSYYNSGYWVPRPEMRLSLPLQVRRASIQIFPGLGLRLGCPARARCYLIAPRLQPCAIATRSRSLAACDSGKACAARGAGSAGDSLKCSFSHSRVFWSRSAFLHVQGAGSMRMPMIMAVTAAALGFGLGFSQPAAAGGWDHGCCGEAPTSTTTSTILRASCTCTTTTCRARGTLNVVHSCHGCCGYCLRGAPTAGTDSAATGDPPAR